MFKWIKKIVKGVQELVRGVQEEIQEVQREYRVRTADCAPEYVYWKRRNEMGYIMSELVKAVHVEEAVTVLEMDREAVRAADRRELYKEWVENNKLLFENKAERNNVIRFPAVG